MAPDRGIWRRRRRRQTHRHHTIGYPAARRCWRNESSGCGRDFSDGHRNVISAICIGREQPEAAQKASRNGDRPDSFRGHASDDGVLALVDSWRAQYGPDSPARLVQYRLSSSRGPRDPAGRGSSASTALHMLSTGFSGLASSRVMASTNHS
jgi:hypothetical protein